jgi:hypothetical protein
MTGMKTILVTLCVGLIVAENRAATVEERVIEVAPRVAQTRSQMWPRAAWNDGAKCWLVAWREGNTGEMAADIWCARVSAAGESLDPVGIKVCSVADNQERPWVCSDGKGFLVVWEDFRNGKDYDVYAARVTAEGKVLDPDGFQLAGGEHNQCHPVAAFAGGNYYVAWQGFGGDGERYLLYGSRVSSDGKALDGKGVVITVPGGDPVIAEASAYNPIIAPMGDRILIAHLVSGGGSHGKMMARTAVVCVDGKTGRPEGSPQILGPAEQRMPALACGAGGGLCASPLGVSSRNTGLSLYRIDANGKAIGAPQTIAGVVGAGLSPLFTLAFDGKGYLLTMDRPVMKGRNMQRIKVSGWSLPADGQPLPGTDLKDEAFDKHGFAISGEGDKYQMQGFGCAGPASVCLVVYVEVRGPDELKVLARMIKGS